MWWYEIFIHSHCVAYSTVLVSEATFFLTLCELCVFPSEKAVWCFFFCFYGGPFNSFRTSLIAHHHLLRIACFSFQFLRKKHFCVKWQSAHFTDTLQCDMSRK